VRINVSGNPVLPKDERTLNRFFRTDVFSPPARGTLGSASQVLLYGPGTNNWDLSILKNFPLWERLRLQFRCEMYNAFNHTQYSSLDTNARFDPAGRQVNQRFGAVVAASDPRIMQFALRLMF
jgi:hypothetical protein